VKKEGEIGGCVGENRVDLSGCLCMYGNACKSKWWVKVGE